MKLLGLTLVFLLGAAAALVAETLWRHGGRLELPGATSPLPAGAASPKAIAAGIERCRDDCEQWAIVAQAGDAALRACRAACDAKAPPRPYDPVRKITKAPADHGKTVLDEKD